MAKKKPSTEFKFTKEQKAVMRRESRRLHDLLETVDKFERCGSDCEELRADIAELQEFFAKVDKEFIAS